MSNLGTSTIQVYKVDAVALKSKLPHLRSDAERMHAIVQSLPCSHPEDQRRYGSAVVSFPNEDQPARPLVTFHCGLCGRFVVTDSQAIA